MEGLIKDTVSAFRSTNQGQIVSSVSVRVCPSANYNLVHKFHSTQGGVLHLVYILLDSSTFTSVLLHFDP